MRRRSPSPSTTPGQTRVVVLDQVVETHVTSTNQLLFAGGQVYKVRRPVSIAPYIDYACRSRRAQSLVREFERGRAHFPWLYRDVVEVTGRGLGGEPALHMRDFRGTWRVLSAVLRTRPLQADLFGRLLGFAAGFHGRSSTHSVAASVARRTEMTLEESALLGVPLLPSVAARLRKFAHGFERVCAERPRSDWVRPLHGDLHAGNLVVTDEHVRAFDFSDFDLELAHGDVALDFGFFGVDVVTYQASDIAERFLHDLARAAELSAAALGGFVGFALLNRANVLWSQPLERSEACAYLAALERLAPGFSTR